LMTRSNSRYFNFAKSWHTGNIGLERHTFSSIAV